MSSKQVYFIMTGLIVLFIAMIGGGTYDINTMLTKQSQTLVNTKAKQASLNQEQVELAQAKKDIAKYNDLYKVARTVVPQSKDQTETVRQIVNLASGAGVSIQSITFPTSTLGTSSISPSAGASATASPLSAGPSAIGTGASLSQLQKVPNIPGVYYLQLIVTSSTDTNSLATYPQLINFLSSLEQNRLTALVNSIAIQPSSTSKNGAFQFQLTLDIYIKPGTTK